MSAKPLFIAALLALLTISVEEARATASIVIDNQNAAGVGFNDPAAPDAAAGCQSKETLGECRLRVFTIAAQQWGALLNSNITIKVAASMKPLTCSGSSAVLGSAGPTYTVSDFPNAPVSGTSYVLALANALSDTHQVPGAADLTANFNVDIDSGDCLTNTTGWWYSTDPLTPIPSNRIPLLPVVFHEIAHGLGFVSLYNPSTGAAYTPSKTPVWGHYLYDTSSSKLWKEMTNTERKASATNDPSLVWTGPRTSAELPNFLAKPAAVVIDAPSDIAGVYVAQTASFGPSVHVSPATGSVVLAQDGSASPTEACEPLINAAAVNGKIALLDRGTCNFTVKVKNAQDAGAIGVIVANNAPTGLAPMGGSDATIVIPALGVTQAAGTSFKTWVGGGVNATLGVDINGDFAGTSSGCIRMFAPTPVQTGSSVSHFHSDAFPDLLMEPSLNESLFDTVDLTLPLFRDIGWNPTTELPPDIFSDGFEALGPRSTAEEVFCQFVQP